MKYVILGGAGNISRPLAASLLKAGHEVTVVGRQQKNLQPLLDAGATAAVGSVDDVAFLTATFKGADAVYSMVPPKWDAAEWKKYIAQTGEGYAKAIKEAGVRYVVNLSSIGAHLPEGCGPVSGLYGVEQALNALKDVNVLHLRAAYFYQNLLANVSLAKNAGIIGGNFGAGEKGFPIVDPSDIAAAAAAALLSLSFTGHSVQYVVSDEVSTADVATGIGEAIGNPSLAWVVFSDDQALQGMLGAGLSEEVAKNYVEMGQAMNSGKMGEDYQKHKTGELGKVKLKDFVQIFAAVYKAG